MGTVWAAGVVGCAGMRGCGRSDIFDSGRARHGRRERYRDLVFCVCAVVLPGVVFSNHHSVICVSVAAPV